MDSSIADDLNISGWCVINDIVLSVFIGRSFSELLKDKFINGSKSFFGTGSIING